MSESTNLNLRYGSKGPAVKFLQSSLNSVHKVGTALKEDGVFGNLTTEKVKSFQKTYGLVPDGIVGSLTTKKLSELVNADPNIANQIQKLEVQTDKLSNKKGSNKAALVFGSILVLLGIAAAARK